MASNTDKDWLLQPTKAKRSKQGNRPEICIIHTSKPLKLSEFVYINNEEQLSSLQNIKLQRENEPIDSPYRMADECKMLNDELHVGDDIGYHRECHQNFTKNLRRLSDTIIDTSAPSSSMKTRSSTSSTSTKDKVLFTTDCIFCNKTGPKYIYKKGEKKVENMCVFDRGGGENVQTTAEDKNDEKLLTRIRGVDLFSVEAKYHPSCRKSYTRVTGVGRTRDTEARNHQLELEKAHEKAFQVVCKVVLDDIIGRKQILKLDDLREQYIRELNQTSHPNSNYRAEKLKAKLQKHEEIGKQITFTSVMDNTLSSIQGKFTSQIVFCNSMDIEYAIKLAYKLGAVDSVKDVANMLRQTIFNAFQSSEELPWPPTAEYLKQLDGIVPDMVLRFLKIVLSGSETNEDTRLNRVVLSVAQDICRAVTNGRWKMPKHVLLCMTLRHMFRSKQLLTLLNRFGHSENYSFGLELETAIANSVQLSSTVLSPEIVRNPEGKSVFHSEFDNFDKLVNELYGAGMVNFAHGIMLQDLESDEVSEEQTPSVPRTKQRTFHYDKDVNLPECYVTHRKSPQFTIKQKTYNGSDEAFLVSRKRNILWMLLRSICKTIPGWAGFVSITGDAPKRKTIIGYYPVIHQPITDYKTVQECLKIAEDATKEVGQEYTIITFDLGVCMKAYPLVWNDPYRYSKHILLIGTFHLICAYFHAIGKKMNSCGLSDILLEAELVKSGTVHGVMGGKNYSRAMVCHKTMLEALERLLLSSFLEKRSEEAAFENLPDESKDKIKKILTSPNKESIESAVIDPHISKYVNDYFDFKSNVRSGVFGKTGQFWITYMDHVWLTLQLHKAVKRNDFLLYSHCIHLMPDLFFSYDGQNYARYLTMFSVMMANIDESHPGSLEILKKGAFSVARSIIPGCRTDVDKTMEETFMKHSKSHGGASGKGLSGITRNYEAYQRWVRTTHERAKYLAATLSVADMSNESHTHHKDLSKSWIKKGQAYVTKTVEAIENFANPFSYENENLINVSSGASVPCDIENDLMNAEIKGKEARERFVVERLERGENFFEPVTRLKLKTMGHMNTSVKVTSSQNKTIEYRNQSNVITKLLVKSLEENVSLDMAKVMAYCLTPVPYCIGTADGFLSKTDKAKSFSNLTKDVANEIVPRGNGLTIEDGNALFYLMKQIPNDFEQICGKIFGMVASQGDVIVSTDMYSTSSVKSLERKRRGSGEKLILKGKKTKKPSDWKKFLTNSENKEQLIDLMFTVWSQTDFLNKIEGRSVMLIKQGEAFNMSKDGVEVMTILRSNQEETDSRVVLYAMYADSQGYPYVRVKTPDSDIFWILLYHASSINTVVLYDTGYGNKKRLINISSLSKHYSSDMCNALLGLHALTGCDTVSAFKGKGKVRPMKLLLKSPEFSATLSKLGEQWEVTDELVENIEKFVCAVYGNRKKITKVDEMRHFLLKSKCDDDISTNTIKNIDLAALPPTKACLEEHIRRANYQVRIWKQAHIGISELPKPWNGHGWLENGEPCWCKPNAILPPSLVDVLVTNNDELMEDDAIDEDIDLISTELVVDMFDSSDEEDEDDEE